MDAIDDSGWADLRWMCPDCGYQVLGSGLLDSTLRCWLALVEEHCEFGCLDGPSTKSSLLHE